MTVQKVKSLSGKSAETYIPVQARMDHGNLHVQGAGPNVNRPYGVSQLIPLKDQKLIGKLHEIKCTLFSLGGEHKYFPMQIKRVGERLYVQIECEPYNRRYGIALIVSATMPVHVEQLPLAAFVLAVEEEMEVIDLD